MTDRRRGRWAPAAAGVLALATAAVLVATQRAVGRPPRGLAPTVEAALPRAAAESAVTAVLLDFRGWDTLLEVTVLLAAGIAVWAAGAMRPLPRRTPSPLVVWFDWLVTPVLLLVAGALVVAGASRPGGAFQAGAVGSGVVVLLELANRSPSRFAAWRRLRRPMAAAGALAFLATAIVTSARGGLLAYGASGPLATLVVEGALVVALMVLLGSFVAGGAPEADA